ncbi:hypothetical protein ACIBKY_38490 [Nonomuraea sp. NPDC050394]|uniref:hypothetical protein n=1 Tax=Nonomuraea sp. NPDC050394 TaxID=3364363 RepID=UPI0037B83889
MTSQRWRKVITSAPAAGIETIQIIGGEPTMRPGFLTLADHVVGTGLKLQVYTNLYRVTDALWAPGTVTSACVSCPGSCPCRQRPHQLAG